MTDLVTKALIFATAAHAAVGQKRKYTGEDYILHPIAVAEIVRGVPHDDVMVAAALLHDVVEDTGVTLDLVHEVFGADVADLIDWLTKPSTFFEKRDPYAERLARSPARAQTIKVADIIHNTASIAERDPKFARAYMREKAQQMDVLTKADPALRSRVLAQLQAYREAV